jgi:hypothetical protein
LSARFAFRSDSQLMWVRVVTGWDILRGAGKKKSADCSAGFSL